MPGCQVQPGSPPGSRSGNTCDAPLLEASFDPPGDKYPISQAVIDFVEIAPCSANKWRRMRVNGKRIWMTWLNPHHYPIQYETSIYFMSSMSKQNHTVNEIDKSEMRDIMRW